MREHADLSPQFAHRARCSGLVQHLLFGGFQLIAGCVFKVVEIVSIEHPALRDEGGNPLALGLEFAQALFKALLAPLERLVDGLRRRGQTPLKDGQRKTDRPGALVVLQGLCPIELLAHVGRDFAVELLFGRRQLVSDRMGDALREEWRTVELDQALLDHPPHEIGDVDLVNTVTEAPFEAVTVE